MTHDEAQDIMAQVHEYQKERRANTLRFFISALLVAATLAMVLA